MKHNKAPTCIFVSPRKQNAHIQVLYGHVFVHMCMHAFISLLTSTESFSKNLHSRHILDLHANVHIQLIYGTHLHIMCIS